MKRARELLNKYAKRFPGPFIVVFLLTVMGCTSSSPPATTSRLHPLEQNAINALGRADRETASRALDAALARYQRLDDLGGQWRITRYQANLALTTGETEQAAVAVRELQSLAGLLDESMVGYETHLIAGRISGENSEFERALTYARTPLETAVVKTYLGDSSGAVRLLEPDAADHPADRAFVYYTHGVSTGSASSFDRALAYYRLAEDSRGIADALLRLARIAKSEDRLVQASALGRRAARVLGAAGDVDRAAAVDRWLTELSL